jgi:hypothetical protein
MPCMKPDGCKDGNAICRRGFCHLVGSSAVLCDFRFAGMSVKLFPTIMTVAIMDAVVLLT